MSIGARTRHVQWEKITAGRQPYTADLYLEGLLLGRILRSPHPHAQVLSIDASAALRVPGVQAIVTAEDLPDRHYVHHGGSLADRPVLARGRVRYVGQEVAAVAAESNEAADEAISKIRVRYRPLRHVTEPEEALRRQAPQLHPDRVAHNVAHSIQRHYGEDYSGSSDLTVMRRVYRFGRQAHVCMEPGSTMAQWNVVQQTLDLWTSTQSPHFIRKEVAHVLGLSTEQVLIHEVAVGGGFGAKSKISDHEAITAALSMQTGRPVRIVLDRREEFSTTKCRHAFDIDIEGSMDISGRLVGTRSDITVDNGAYNHTGPSVMGYAGMVLASQYPQVGADVNGKLVYTNKHPGGQFRGYGAPQANFAIESLVDELADELGLDPIDLRLKNLLEAGDTTLAGWKIVSTHLAECLSEVRERIDWARKRAAAGDGRGVGVAIAVTVSGARVYPGAERSGAAVDVHEDGQVRLRFSGADAGTWQRTMLAQVVAEELSTVPEAVSTVMMETGAAPADMGAWSSRGTYMGAHATRKAAKEAAEKLLVLAADKFGCDPSDVLLRDSRAEFRGQRVGYGELAAVSTDQREGWLTTEAEFETTAAEHLEPESGVANLSATYSFAAHAVEVEVDKATGRIRVLNVIAAHDSGRAINPISVEGQIIGGVTMGLGAALGEELSYQDGQQINPTYLNYALPRAADVPRIQPVLVEHADPLGPYGAKAVGEICLVPTAAAVANAVANAVGVRIRDLPLTPDKVLVALAEKDASQIPPRRSLWLRPSRWWIEAIRWAYPRGLHALLHRYGTRLGRKRKPQKVDGMVGPKSIEQALDHLASGATAIAGGTDVLPRARQGLLPSTSLVDLSMLTELQETVETAEGDLIIGAGMTLADLARSLDERTDAVLAETIKTIASQQIREMATVGGNLCQEKRCWFFRNGFTCYKSGGSTCPCYAVEGDHRFHHAALGAHRCQAVTPSDLATTLTALDAEVILAGRGQSRQVPLAEFYQGPGETILADDELVKAVRVPGLRGAGGLIL